MPEFDELPRDTQNALWGNWQGMRQFYQLPPDVRQQVLENVCRLNSLEEIREHARQAEKQAKKTKKSKKN
ncbi:MAG: hypothetical protein ACOX7F_09595 [Eubacteriales bacterium]